MALRVYFCILKVHAESILVLFFFLNMHFSWISCVVHLDILGTLMGGFLVTKPKFLKERFGMEGGESF